MTLDNVYRLYQKVLCHDILFPRKLDLLRCSSSHILFCLHTRSDQTGETWISTVECLLLKLQSWQGCSQDHDFLPKQLHVALCHSVSLNLLTDAALIQSPEALFLPQKSGP